MIGGWKSNSNSSSFNNDSTYCLICGPLCAYGLRFYVVEYEYIWRIPLEIVNMNVKVRLANIRGCTVDKGRHSRAILRSTKIENNKIASREKT